MRYRVKYTKEKKPVSIKVYNNPGKYLFTIFFDQLNPITGEQAIKLKIGKLTLGIVNVEELYELYLKVQNLSERSYLNE